jgi:cystathionine beta-lyase/cystathionine gamma-synthase
MNLEIKNQNMVINYADDNEPYYCRSTSYQNERLRTLLTTCYAGAFCILVPSGTAAITTVLESCGAKFVKLNPAKKIRTNVVILDEMYSDTPRLCRKFAVRRHNTVVKVLDPLDSEGIITTFNTCKNDSNILLIESCTNPRGKIFDPELLKQIKVIAPNTMIIVDNTWLSHIVYNPLTISSVDFVVLSLTKYYSAATVIGGAIISNFNALVTFDDLVEWTKYFGYHMSPYTANVIFNNISSDCENPNNNKMKERLTSSFNKTCAIMNYVEKNCPDLVDIKYPLNPNHPSYNIATKYFNTNSGPSVITFHTFASVKKVKSILNKLTIIKPITSYGHPFTTLCNYISSSRYDDKQVAKLRIAIGYEDDLEKIIEGINELRLLLST